MTDERLALSVWDTLTTSEREEAARAVAERLPAPFVFKGLKTYALGAQTHEMALFGWKRSTFVLIPGGTAQLGFGGSAGDFSEEQRESWEESQDELELTLSGFLEISMTKPRTAVLEPFLMEVRPKELSRYAEWDRVKERLAKQGFRLPAPDEWEYACGAGATTLFRWGETCPLDATPISKSAWKLHERPNAFGLRMPFNPYHWELTSETGVLRGGDGGGMLCGGMSDLACWLPLATAFNQPWGNVGPTAFGAFLRRVYALG